MRRLLAAVVCAVATFGYAAPVQAASIVYVTPPSNCVASSGPVDANGWRDPWASCNNLLQADKMFRVHVELKFSTRGWPDVIRHGAWRDCNNAVSDLSSLDGAFKDAWWGTAVIAVDYVDDTHGGGC